MPPHASRQAQVAGDLRLVAGLLHVTQHLARMGDLCANVARAVPELADRPAPPEIRVTLAEMGGRVTEVVTAALGLLRRPRCRRRRAAPGPRRGGRPPQRPGLRPDRAVHRP